MKRLFVALSLAASLIAFSSFANDKAGPDVLKSFFHTFSKAENVSWCEVDGMLRFSFTQDGQQHFAYYENDDLVVVATEIKREALPSALQAQLEKYKDYSLTQVYRLEKDRVADYCVVLDNGSKHLVLKGRNKWKVCVEEIR